MANISRINPINTPENPYIKTFNADVHVSIVSRPLKKDEHYWRPWGDSNTRHTD
jgi:hypothetical protein